MKSAILYYPSAMRLERLVRWGALPVCLGGAVVMGNTRNESPTLPHILGVAFIAYSAIWFGTTGSVMLVTEVLLLFDRERRGEHWRWWFALLSFLVGIGFMLAASAWVWLLLRK